MSSLSTEWGWWFSLSADLDSVFPGVAKMDWHEWHEWKELCQPMQVPVIPTTSWASTFQQIEPLLTQMQPVIKCGVCHLENVLVNIQFWFHEPSLDCFLSRGQVLPGEKFLLSLFRTALQSTNGSPRSVQSRPCADPGTLLKWMNRNLEQLTYDTNWIQFHPQWGFDQTLTALVKSRQSVSRHCQPIGWQTRGGLICLGSDIANRQAIVEWICKDTVSPSSSSCFPVPAPAAALPLIPSHQHLIITSTPALAHWQSCFADPSAYLVWEPFLDSQVWLHQTRVILVTRETLTAAETKEQTAEFQTHIGLSGQIRQRVAFGLGHGYVPLEGIHWLSVTWDDLHSWWDPVAQGQRNSEWKQVGTRFSSEFRWGLTSDLWLHESGYLREYAALLGCESPVWSIDLIDWFIKHMVFFHQPEALSKIPRSHHEIHWFHPLGITSTEPLFSTVRLLRCAGCLEPWLDAVLDCQTAGKMCHCRYLQCHRQVQRKQRKLHKIRVQLNEILTQLTSEPRVDTDSPNPNPSPSPTQIQTRIIRQLHRYQILNRQLKTCKQLRQTCKTQLNYFQNANRPDTCSICLESVPNVITHCGHWFCLPCLFQHRWHKLQNVQRLHHHPCPVCQQEIRRAFLFEQPGQFEYRYGLKLSWVRNLVRETQHQILIVTDLPVLEEYCHQLFPSAIIKTSREFFRHLSLFVNQVQQVVFLHAWNCPPTEWLTRLTRLEQAALNASLNSSQLMFHWCFAIGSEEEQFFNRVFVHWSPNTLVNHHL